MPSVGRTPGAAVPGMGPALHFKTSRKGERKENSRPWTADECDNLRAIVAAAADPQKLNWNDIGRQMPGRNGKQCREKWKNDLRPHISKDDWTAQEEFVLVMMHASFGNKWSSIADYLPTRSENHIKNNWNSTLRSKDAKKSKGLLWLYGRAILQAIAANELAETAPPGDAYFERAKEAYLAVNGRDSLEAVAVGRDHFRQEYEKLVAAAATAPGGTSTGALAHHTLLGSTERCRRLSSGAGRRVSGSGRRRSSSGASGGRRRTRTRTETDDEEEGEDLANTTTEEEEEEEEEEEDDVPFRFGASTSAEGAAVADDGAAAFGVTSPGLGKRRRSSSCPGGSLLLRLPCPPAQSSCSAAAAPSPTHAGLPADAPPLPPRPPRLSRTTRSPRITGDGDGSCHLIVHMPYGYNPDGKPSNFLRRQSHHDLLVKPQVPPIPPATASAPAYTNQKQWLPAALPQGCAAAAAAHWPEVQMVNVDMDKLAVDDLRIDQDLPVGGFGQVDNDTASAVAPTHLLWADYSCMAAGSRAAAATLTRPAAAAAAAAAAGHGAWRVPTAYALQLDDAWHDSVAAAAAKAAVAAAGDSGVVHEDAAQLGLGDDEDCLDELVTELGVSARSEAPLSSGEFAGIHYHGQPYQDPMTALRAASRPPALTPNSARPLHLRFNSAPIHFDLGVAEDPDSGAEFNASPCQMRRPRVAQLCRTDSDPLLQPPQPPPCPLSPYQPPQCTGRPPWASTGRPNLEHLGFPPPLPPPHGMPRHRSHGGSGGQLLQLDALKEPSGSFGSPCHQAARGYGSSTEYDMDVGDLLPQFGRVQRCAHGGYGGMLPLPLDPTMELAGSFSCRHRHTAAVNMRGPLLQQHISNSCGEQRCGQFGTYAGGLFLEDLEAAASRADGQCVLPCYGQHGSEEEQQEFLQTSRRVAQLSMNESNMGAGLSLRRVQQQQQETAPAFESSHSSASGGRGSRACLDSLDAAYGV